MRVNVNFKYVVLKGSFEYDNKIELLFRDTIFQVTNFSCYRDVEVLIENHFNEGYLGDEIYAQNTNTFYKKWLKSFECKGISGMTKVELFNRIKTYILVNVNSKGGN